MLPDLAELTSVLAILAVLALALHKRDWSSIPARLMETRSGQRRYLFGPPDRNAALSADLRVRVLQRLRGELRRAMELGVPLLAAAWYAEIAGIDARRRRDATWRESKRGLLLRHLIGEMTEAELESRLRQRGYLPPARELTLPQARLMPPIRWRLEWDRRLSEMEAEASQQRPDEGMSSGLAEAPELAAVAPTAAPDAPAAAERPGNGSAAGMPCDEAAVGPPAEPAVVTQIHTLGEIRIFIDGDDVAPELMHAPALAFIVLYVLAWEVRRPGDRVTREQLGEETFRGQNPQARRRGVSQRLTNLKREFPRLRDRIRGEGEYLGFESTDSVIDVRWVLEVAGRVKAAEGRITSDLHEEARSALALAAREFMPGWDRVESKGTLGGSGAAGVIEEVRDSVVAARLDILAGLADAALARQQLDDAVAHLEEALQLRPERTALARKLADLHERNGHRQRAARLRGEYGLDEAS